jgi:uncharacterized protein
MQVISGLLHLAPTDLSRFLGCRHGTGLDLWVAQGLLEKPQRFDPVVEALRERGAEHERNHVESLRAQGLRVVDVRETGASPDATLAAMESGADVVVQGALEAGAWQGYADVLRRVETPSRLGAWSYEAYDTKLARETRGATILQLAVYSDLLSEAQGTEPAYFHVVTPDPVAPVHSYRFAEFAAYYRLVRQRFGAMLEQGPKQICQEHEQARVQDEQRTKGTPVHELLDIEPGRGLTRLPAPSPGDLFLDLEGAPYAREGGREYLFGLWSPDYEGRWAFDDVEERAAFEAVIDRITEGWAADPSMHVYHFGHYEPTAFKRLMGRHATRADELDRLLRSERFVDLHTIVRQSLRAGVENYSIKELEQYYGFVREVALRDATAHRLTVEMALEGNAPMAITDAVREAVAAYNRDDCKSTQALRDWLEGLRAAVEAAGTAVPRPEAKPGDPSEKVSELDQEAEAIRAGILATLAPEASDPAHHQHPLWLLAYLVDWHRREAKAQWWDYFRVRELDDEDLLNERGVLVGLELVGRVAEVKSAKTGKPTGSVIDRYRYPRQEVDFGRGTRLKLRDGSTFGEVADRDASAVTIDVKKGKAAADLHPDAVFADEVVSTTVLQRAVMRLATMTTAEGCGMDVLFRRSPRLKEQALQRAPGESDIDHAIRIVTALDRSALSVQGPPGSGKTFVGAQVIRALVRAGKRVGVTAVSHKVIRNLLDEVWRQAADAKEELGLGQKVPEVGDDASPVFETTDKTTALEALRGGKVQVLGGTSWLWADEQAGGLADVLFVDEAGQMSLANVLAVSLATANLVLLGDPQQLEQPQKGTHPDGVSVSALEHVLGGEKTMPADRGMFLGETWRLAPGVCTFTSEMFYESRLRSRPGLENQRLVGTGGFDGAGLWWAPAEHDGNQTSSAEEVEVVAKLVERLLTPDATWADADGASRALTANDVLVVAPYNAQVNQLSERLARRGIRVGTVDKFQGQQAPIVIYSMATSRPEDAPRGLEFLYSLNRLNVATSRARCAAIVVAAPALLEPEWRTPRQMQLANALCRFKELATAVDV